MSQVPRTVALRNSTTGRYLAVGGQWLADDADALWLDRSTAVEVRRRFSCEPAAIELVEKAAAGMDRDRAVA
jgi:hypothetical protein